MKINIYYGGRGLFDDPTLFVLGIMEKVFAELGVSTERFMLYELKNRISTLPQTLKEADGIILASTVEWFGVGGYMQMFLDACYLYGDKEKIAQTYMCPVVMSTTYGEREGKLYLSSAWEILGGLPCSGLCGYISDMAELEINENYRKIVEKKAEDTYRTMSKHLACLPASNQAVRQKIAQVRNFRFTPQENEQLSQYASDEEYVEAQKADIQELTSMFRGMMSGSGSEKEQPSEEQTEGPALPRQAPVSRTAPRNMASAAGVYQKPKAVSPAPKPVINPAKPPQRPSVMSDARPSGRPAKTAEAKRLETVLQANYMPISGFKATVRMNVEEEGTYDILMAGTGVSVVSEPTPGIPSVELRLEREVLDKILSGKVTFLKAFMIGEIRMTGDFQVLRTMDQVLRFSDR